jgi:predicted transglutaminase-like cysteine proteinase
MARKPVAQKLAAMLAATVASIAVLSTPAPGATATPLKGTSADVFGRAVRVSASHVIGWGPMYARYQSTAKTDPVWQGLIEDGRKVSSDALLDHVNRRFNQIVYRSDALAWGKSDYWATPSELVTRGGDCEDFAIAKFLALRELGTPSSEMRIIVLRGEARSPDHAVLMVKTASGPVVLDNRWKDVYPLSSRLTSHVAFAFNDTHMWIPRGSVLARLQY